MKKVILSVAMLVSIASFAQKEELKTLKKIYAKNSISEKDLAEYKEASNALSGLASEKSDVVYAKFYKAMYPTVVLASKGDKATMQDQMALYSADFIKQYGIAIDETIAFEKESGKKIYTDELIQEKLQFKQGLANLAYSMNKASKFKEGSSFFYALYLFDPKNEGQSLENAAIMAVQAKDYKLAEKLYTEFAESDYLNNGTMYFAINKASGNEESFPNRDARVKMIASGVYEKPRDVKMTTKKPDVYKTLAIVIDQNGDSEKAKLAYDKAYELNPSDQEIKDAIFRLNFNSGYDKLKGDRALVDEMNNNLNNKAKFDELMVQRKAIFKNALPDFEKAYSVKKDDNNTKQLLKMAYDILDMKEKANTIK
ncbi:hypothetical protein ACFS5J_00950 [Flavobacterium chuncheonense]|uniref:Tetratricopeptide repeat protein n=1 Tax=Flavobacterium chuncheonense TaxID=2026653 RepID=A0ABW5YHL9_9FLAO